MTNISSKALKENVIKNIIVLLLGGIGFIKLKTALSLLSVEQSSDFLLIVSMLLVTVCFANFAFSYEYSDFKKLSTRLLSHFATGLFMFLTLLFLEMIIIVGGAIYPFLYEVLFVIALALYLGCVLYDFWDLLRISNK